MAHEEQPLPCLPGASRDPGTGGVSQVLLDALFEDAALLALPAEQAVAAHREHREAWYAGLVGPLLVPVGSVEAVCAAFGPAEDGLRVALLSEPSAGQEAIHRAGDVLREDGRAEVVAVHLPLPAGGDPGSAARQLLDALALSVPARVELRPEPGWEEALAALAEDGAEEVALRCGPADPGRPGGPGWPPVELARALRSVVDRGLTVRVLGVRTAVGAAAGERGPDGAPSTVGALNLLCAVRAALNGAESAELADVVAETSAAPLAAAARRMSDPDAAVVRAFLTSVAAVDVPAVVAELVGLGLVTASAD